MAGNTVSHGFAPSGKNHLSVRVQHRENRWVLRFRDDCRAFDPVSYVPSGEEDALGIRLVMAMADDIRYTYSLNMNNLTIRLTAGAVTAQP
jgi:two-component sensor histidine kinase